MILIILLVVYIAWRIIRKKDHEIEELEDEVDDLEDEVDEFDKAKKMAKKVIAAKKSAPLKPVVTPMIEESRVKKTPLKKTVAKNPTLTKTPPITPKKKSAPNTPNE